MIGGLVGGAALALALWLLATPLRTLLPWLVRLTVFAALCGMFVVWDLGVRRVPRALRRGQVPIEWSKRFGLTQSYFLYGVGLGAGVFTFVPFAVTFGVFAAAALVAGPLTAALAGAAFGLGRTIFVGPLGLSGSAIRRSDALLVLGYRWFPYASVALTVVLVVGVAFSA